MNLDEINEAISKAGKKWKAEDNRIHRLSDSEKKYRLGYVPEPGKPSLQEREDRAKAKAGKAIAVAAIAATFDWRTANGGGWITPIKDQGSCGSCVAFGTIATAEAKIRISKNNAALAVDYSEADLFYCGTGDANACEVQDTGVVDEACFPYTAKDQPCNLCDNSQTRKTKITGWHEIEDVNEMKTWISTNSPLTSCFTVYEDFYAYTSGVYSPTTNQVEGGHCISVVGYDDTQNCWICKNSWGPGWGENGFFRIAYGDCGIDATMWAIDGM
jgi:C1A family cysteine protease